MMVSDSPRMDELIESLRYVGVKNGLSEKQLGAMCHEVYQTFDGLEEKLTNVLMAYDACVEDWRKAEEELENMKQARDFYMEQTRILQDTPNEPGLRAAAKDLHDYLWENCPDIIELSTHSELAGEGLKKRLQALKDALK